MRGVVATALCWIVLASAAARADTFVLKDDAKIYGLLEKEEKDKDGKVWSVIRTTYGRVRVPKELVAKTLPSAGRRDTLYLEEARVTSLRGTAERSADDGRTWDRVPWTSHANDATHEPFALPTLKAGERLRTDAASEVVLDVGYGTVVIDASSEVKLKKEAGATIDLLRGRVGAKVEDLPADRRFRVETPQSTLAVKGTSFAAEADGRCAVEEGDVELRPHAGGDAVHVVAGHASAADGSVCEIGDDATRVMGRAASAEQDPRLDWVRVPGGEFDMGSADPPTHSENLDARPVHRVRVAAFLIARTEARVRDLDAFRSWSRANPDYSPLPDDREFTPGRYPHVEANGRLAGFEVAEPDLPAQVRWLEADAFARWCGGEVVSEAQWEYVARNAGAKRWIRDPTTVIAEEWCLENSGIREVAPFTNASVAAAGGQSELELQLQPRLHAVGTRGVGALGVCDLLGNSREWTADAAVPGYDGVPTDGTPRLNTAVDLRVVRGGGFNSFAADCGNAAMSIWRFARPSSDYFGVRVVRRIPQ